MIISATHPRRAVLGAVLLIGVLGTTATADGFRARYEFLDAYTSRKKNASSR